MTTWYSIWIAPLPASSSWQNCYFLTPHNPQHRLQYHSRSQDDRCRTSASSPCPPGKPWGSGGTWWSCWSSCFPQLHMFWSKTRYGSSSWSYHGPCSKEGPLSETCSQVWTNCERENESEKHLLDVKKATYISQFLGQLLFTFCPLNLKTACNLFTGLEKHLKTSILDKELRTFLKVYNCRD